MSEWLSRGGKGIAHHNAPKLRIHAKERMLPPAGPVRVLVQCSYRHVFLASFL